MRNRYHIGGAWGGGAWRGDWRADSWASARGLWRRPSAEEDAEDGRTWHEACCDEGGLLRVLWCELRQLFGDLTARQDREPAREGRDAS